MCPIELEADRCRSQAGVIKGTHHVFHRTGVKQVRCRSQAGVITGTHHVSHRTGLRQVWVTSRSDYGNSPCVPQNWRQVRCRSQAGVITTAHHESHRTGGRQLQVTGRSNYRNSPCVPQNWTLAGAGHRRGLKNRFEQLSYTFCSCSSQTAQRGFCSF